MNKLVCYKKTPDKTNVKPCHHYVPDDSLDMAGYCALPSEFRCIEDVKAKSLKLSHSAVRDFVTCKRKFYIRYIKGIAQKPHLSSRAIKMGSLWDKMMNETHSTSRDGFDNKVINDEIHRLRIDNISLAKVRAVKRAYDELIDPEFNNLIGTQQELFYQFWDSENQDVFFHGFVDILYIDYFKELKFTGYPETYTNHPFKISSQVGTYFLCDGNLKYVVIEATQSPNLRLGKYEDVKDYEKRIYKDVMSRPSYYFTNYDVMKKKFGVVFYRSEFDGFMNSIYERFMWITQEIRESMERNSWYTNDLACNLFNNDCEYFPICKNYSEINDIDEYVNDEIYEKREIQ